VPVVATAILALVLSREYAAPLAYIGGSMGTLIGADILNLDNIGSLGAPIASIGGAGTFDGIFLTGILGGAARRPCLAIAAAAGVVGERARENGSSTADTGARQSFAGRACRRTAEAPESAGGDGIANLVELDVVNFHRGSSQRRITSTRRAIVPKAKTFSRTCSVAMSGWGQRTKPLAR